MSKKHFIDNTYVLTDLQGSLPDQRFEIGWFDSKSCRYFNPDEVQELFELGETENVAKGPDGKLYMKEMYLDFRVAFQVVCGIPFGADESDKNLLDYARKVGLVTDKPVPIEMYCGIKSLEIRDDGLYNIKYQFKENWFSNKTSLDFVAKMTVGRINRLRSLTYKYLTKEGEEDRHYFECEKVGFDKNSLVLSIQGISKQYVCCKEITSQIRNMDLEFLVSNYEKVDFYSLLTACKDWCRDYGQYHWLNEIPKDSKELTNTYWYDKME